jgi:hypothetical protein
MEELTRLVSEKTGLSEEMSRKAVETVIGYLKDKLPAPIAGQIDALVKTGGGGGSADDLVSGLGGLLGKK